MRMEDFDYDPETSDFSFVSEQKKIQVDSQNLVVLSPSEEESKKIVDASFADGQVFMKK